MDNEPVPANQPLILRIALDQSDSDAIAGLAAALEGSGFAVLEQSRRALTVRATAHDVEYLFGCKVINRNRNLQFSTSPLFDKLPVTEGVRVYFPRQPEYF